MKAYTDLLKAILTSGEDREDRTGVGTRSLFGYQMRIPLQQGFPLLTTKKVFLRGIIAELLWFLRGETHVGWLQEQKVRIWDPWATQEECAKFGRETGDLGPIYGHQWRNFGATPKAGGGYHLDGFDQLQYILDTLRTNPSSRRLIVSGWNPEEANQVTLPPCHTLFQFFVSPSRKLSCQLYQRSADVFLGVPFNIASYALLTMMIATMCDLELGDFVHTFGDAHLYLNHLDLAKMQLEREERELPQMILHNNPQTFEEWQLQDFELVGYNPHPAIKAPIAV